MEGWKAFVIIEELGLLTMSSSNIRDGAVPSLDAPRPAHAYQLFLTPAAARTEEKVTVTSTNFFLLSLPGRRRQLGLHHLTQRPVRPPGYRDLIQRTGGPRVRRSSGQPHHQPALQAHAPSPR